MGAGIILGISRNVEQINKSNATSKDNRYRKNSGR